MIPKETAELFLKHQYRFAGEHSAVKICEWTKKSLRNEGACYKQKFYGIESHRCLQMTPSVSWCPNRCVYCWRAIEKTEESPKTGEKTDNPNDIIDRCIEAQRKLLTGFKGLERVERKKWKEAQNPNQAAISLSGEPTAYPRISELINEFHRRGFTTFLVTNGQYPERLEGMTEPTNLYISLDAPDRETYRKVDAPMLKDYWKRLNRSLELMNGFSCTKVIRLTLVKGWNDHDPEGYAELIKKAGADFIEVKSYMWVGYSRLRLKEKNMLLHDEVKSFAEKISELTGYRYKDEQKSSRVVLLAR
ncbi:MAG: 4-demethylwyosine synthase TYW1 [Candidatus Aenigmarchaeota archaeon]|nr:4-demethylwyosine synthase TYW1 [Candidatus Aenigmarchaeota archaeon]